MLRRVRDLLRRARGSRVLRPFVAAADRLWWARVIRRADIVDIDFVATQGRRLTPRRAIRAYVRGGFRDGLSLNPLLMERLVSAQLSDSDRVPALYAYLMNDVRAVRTSVNWDAQAHVRLHPEAPQARGGPVGHAWREARRTGTIQVGSGRYRKSVSWTDFARTAAEGASTANRGGVKDAVDALTAGVVFVDRVGEHDAVSAFDHAIEFVEGAADVVIGISGREVETWAQARLLTLWLPRLQVLRDDAALIPNVEASAAPSAVLVVRGPQAEIAAGDLRELARRGAEEPTAPLWLSPRDGTIVSAGVVLHEDAGHHLLAGHPSEDARALGVSIPVAATAGGTFARTVRAVSTSARTALDLTVRAPGGALRVGAIAGPDCDLDELLAPIDLRIVDWSSQVPQLGRIESAVTICDDTVVPRLRWAIKIAAPPGAPGEAWGDTHFARGLADALRRLGQQVVIDAYDARNRATSSLDDVVLALRGPEPIEPHTDSVSIAWIISHPDQITATEIAGFDAVFAGSVSWAADNSRRLGHDIRPLLQCTDATRFHPVGAARTDEIVFVGTARGIARPSVVEPIRAGVPVSVYGPDWRGYIPAASIVGTGIPNRELPIVYERAGVVLNDHWPAMKAEGFVSNRLFDVVAAGGRAISDDVFGIAEIFDGAVLTYDTIPELIHLLTGDLDAVFPSEERLSLIAARIRRDHTFDARARTLLEAALDARARRARAIRG